MPVGKFGGIGRGIFDASSSEQNSAVFEAGTEYFMFYPFKLLLSGWNYLIKFEREKMLYWKTPK